MSLVPCRVHVDTIQWKKRSKKVETTASDVDLDILRVDAETVILRSMQPHPSLGKPIWPLKLTQSSIFKVFEGNTEINNLPSHTWVSVHTKGAQAAEVKFLCRQASTATLLFTLLNTVHAGKLNSIEATGASLPSPTLSEGPAPHLEQLEPMQFESGANSTPPKSIARKSTQGALTKLVGHGPMRYKFGTSTPTHLSSSVPAKRTGVDAAFDQYSTLPGASTLSATKRARTSIPPPAKSPSKPPRHKKQDQQQKQESSPQSDENAYPQAASWPAPKWLEQDTGLQTNEHSSQLVPISSISTANKSNLKHNDILDLLSDNTSTGPPPRPETNRQSLIASAATSSVARSSPTPRAPVRYEGLRNNGNTCYQNVVLVALLALRAFCASLVRVPPLPAPMHAALSHIVALRKENPNVVIDPQPFSACLARASSKFTRGRQEDAQELLVECLDLLEAEYLKAPPSVAGGGNDDEDADTDGSPTPENPVAALFDATVAKRVVCTSCGASSDSSEIHRGWSLEVVAGGDIATTFARYFAPEKLEYTCEKCAHSEAELQQKLAHAPPILVLHLKRFTVDMYSRINKCTQSVVLAPVLIAPGGVRFSLRALISHLGTSNERGHYTADVRKDDEDRWTTYDDAMVADLGNDAELCRRRAGTAYLLFYTRENAESASDSHLVGDSA